MKIECTVKELKELMRKENIVVNMQDELLPHQFPFFNHQLLQDICKEHQQEVPKEAKN